MAGEMRIDKFLWCVRLSKTRSIATELCRKGRVKIDGIPVKPSREVRAGDEFSVQDSGIIRTFRVLELLNNRVGAKLVVNYITDLTEPEEYEKLRLMQSRGFERRSRGAGRPTKRERRDIDRLKDPG